MFLLLNFSFKSCIRWLMSRTERRLILITWQCRCWENYMNGSGRRWIHRVLPLLKSGYDIISHRFVCALSERWTTSNFHLPVGEMTVTLDDVACLVDNPINGGLIEEEELSYERGIQLLEDKLLFTSWCVFKSWRCWHHGGYSILV